MLADKKSDQVEETPIDQIPIRNSGKEIDHLFPLIKEKNSCHILWVL